jgi:purine-binding chemotaxis protein CheW
MSKPTDERLELISFELAGQTFCIPIASVREIRGWTKVTPLPGAPPGLLGVINLRGVVMPIVDLRSRLGLGEADICDRSVIIVVEDGDRTSGLLVDSVQETLSVDVVQIQPPPHFAGAAEEVVDGVMVHGAELISRLDVHPLIYGGAVPSNLAA